MSSFKLSSNSSSNSSSKSSSNSNSNSNPKLGQKSSPKSSPKLGPKSSPKLGPKSSPNSGSDPSLNSSTKFLGNLSYGGPGAFNPNSSNTKDRRGKVTFIYPDIGIGEKEEVTMYNDDAKTSAHKFVGGFLAGKVDDESTIKEVQVLETPLKSVLSLTKVGFHAFVLFCVKDYWVTFEKHVQGLTIQISKSYDSVAGKHMEKDREKPLTMAVKDEGSKTIKELANFIAEKNLVFEEYNGAAGIHCKKFAADVFNIIAKEKRYNWKCEETLVRGKIATTVATAATALIGGPRSAVVVLTTGAIVTKISARAAREETDLRKKKN